MKYDQIVYPSTQIYASLPEWISEQYPNFVQFARRSLESDERLGFGQDMLQNLEKYRDFDFYKAPIVESNVLDANLAKDEEDSLTLVDGFGFPEKNGVLYLPGEMLDPCEEKIVGEVILYRRREGNVFYELQRGASATIDLGTFVKDSKYVYTVAKNHIRGDKVVNLSVLFLSSMLDTIHQTFAYSIDSKWIADPIDHGTLLERFRDFFQAKGTKLGIKALFKFLFAENDVDVVYPGDRMIEPSESTWTESFIMRTVPLAELLVTPIHNYILPDRLINRELQVKSYNDALNEETKDRVLGRAICDYVSSYEHNDTTQYEMYIQKNNVSGNFPANPFTKLTRTLGTFGTRDDSIDVTTVTVETTLGFPDSGMIFIGTEGIFYESKTFNQFINCQRGFLNVEYDHPIGETVYGPYYVEGKEEVVDPYGRTEELISRSWPLGLVSDVEVVDPGLLHETTDDVYINGPGRIDPREPAISAFKENYDDKLIVQGSVPPYMADHRDRTAAVSGVYFDDEFVFVTSTNFPYHQCGPFSVDYTVGPQMQATNALHIIPRRESIKSNKVVLNEEGETEYFFHDKGFREIGVFSNGVPAFSNVSNQRIIQGIITEYQIIGEGQYYVNPTLLVNDVKVDETITLDEFGLGRVLSITATDQTNYTPQSDNHLPTIEVTGGRNGEVQVNFDRFGRCIEAIITNPGEYYNDTPGINLVDSSDVGKGGALSITVKDGQLDEVTILNPGLDYRAATTRAVITPRGSGAVVVPMIQYYQINRPQEVENQPNWYWDPGNGFLWEKDNAIKQYYGYVKYPILLDEEVSTVAYINTQSEKRIKAENGEDYIIATPLGEGVEHSPIMGYAYDGNPIYGPTVFANGVDGSEGFKKMYSGYVKASSRKEIIPSGSKVTATLPPSEQLYPMGTFVEDYVYEPSLVTRRTRIMSEQFDRLQTETADYILASTPIPSDWVLNKNNAIRTNTPEYPAELYPDGVWIYVCTEVAGEATFPYIIGKTFEDRPISQNAEQQTGTNEQQGFIIYNPDSKYREITIEFDVAKVERYRNPYLTPTKDEIVLEIAHTSEGSISDIEVVDGRPYNSRVGDLISFDNRDTGGTGALGIVSQLDGEEIKKGEGEDIVTTTISHFQRLNLKSNPNQPELDEDGYPVSFTFVESSLITTTSGAEATVVKFDAMAQVLDVFTYTKNLVQPGDSFKDNKGQLVTLGDDTTLTYDGDFVDAGGGMLSIADQTTLFYNNNVHTNQNKLYLGEVTAEETELTPGDLWWSEQNGRLYIYFNDFDSSQWVCTQPIGMRPMGENALDIGIGYGAGNVGPAVTEQTTSKIVISPAAPNSRPDGTPNEPGDMWWCNVTGILYIFINEWICTDPNAVIPTPYASDQANMLGGIEIPEEAYESKVNVIISYIAPTEGPNGETIEIGTLWWSTLTGKMYIYYKDSIGTVQWVITNPVGILSTPYSLDFIPEGDGGGVLPPVTPLPDVPDDGDGGQLGPIFLNKGQSVMWFEHLKDFAAGDKIKFIGGAPGTGLEEICTIDRIVDQHAPAAAVVNRAKIHFPIPDGCNVINMTKSLYTVTTVQPHDLREGDMFTLSGSAYDEVNAEHTVVHGGVISAASGITSISQGKVTKVTVTDPGKGYTSGFYVTFFGGDGVGGYGFAEIDLNTTGVKRVVVLDGGINYTKIPEIYWGDTLTDREFQTYMSKTYPMESELTYTTSSENVQSSVAHVSVASPGLGYKRMPGIYGVYKRAIDRGSFRVNLGGTSISDVEILNGGTRYEYPVAIFYDIQGSGTGARAKVTVTEGTVTGIEMIDNGFGYVEPAMILVEDAGKYIALTNDIGKIESMKILNPGRAVSPDRSLKPEIMIETRLIVKFDTYTIASVIALDGYTDYTFLGLNGYSANSIVSTGRDVSVFAGLSAGDKVYQGTEDGSYKQVTAEVVDYDDYRQILTVRHIMGELKDNAWLYAEDGSKGYVLREGQADCRVVVNGISSPEGRFIDDTSMISSSWAHIQDSYYYQKFSYSIQSPLQQHQFDEFVQEIIHPAGFIMFSDLDVKQVLPTTLTVNDPIISGEVEAILSPDSYNVEYTAISSGPTPERTNPALSPDTGTTGFTD